MARKPPTRTCVACGNTADKRTMLRVVRSPEGDVSFDPSGRAPGRGAYVCFDEGCFDKVAAKRLLDTRLRVKLAPRDYEALGAEFRELCVRARQCSRDGE